MSTAASRNAVRAQAAPAAAGAPLGLLGGTFDPVHAGHLGLAAAAQQQLGLAEVRFIPAGTPWQKDVVSAAEHRLRMLELATAGHAGWSVDGREISRTGPTYTVDTLESIRTEVGARRPVVWILGQDQLARLPTWHHWERLAQLAHIACAGRAGSGAPLDAIMTEYLQRHGAARPAVAQQACGSVVHFAMDPVPCSATQIRAALAAGDTGPARAYLAPAVFNYVQSHHLYG